MLGSRIPRARLLRRRTPDPSENARSAGFVLSFNSFRFVDLGDLTWNKELELACPNNLLGKVDVYLTTHHGLDQSNSPAIVHALASDGGDHEQRGSQRRDSVGVAGDSFIAGLAGYLAIAFCGSGGEGEQCAGHVHRESVREVRGKYLQLTVQPDGTYTVYNSRNKYTRTYHAGS